MAFLNLFIYLFLAVLGLRFCARAFSSCGERGPRFIAVRGPLTIAASLVAEHRLQTRRLSSCGSRAQLLRGMWDPPRPGLEPVSPALAGGFLTTAPPGKPYGIFKCWKRLAKNRAPWHVTRCFLRADCDPDHLTNSVTCLASYPLIQTTFPLPRYPRLIREQIMIFI